MPKTKLKLNKLYRLKKMMDVKAIHNKAKQKAPTNEKLALVSLNLGDKLQLLSAFLP